MNRLPSSSASTPSIAFGSSVGISGRKEGDSTRARPTPVKQASSVPRIVCGLLKRYTASRLSASDDGLEAAGSEAAGSGGESGTMAESACAHGAAAREQSGDNLSVAIEGRTTGRKHEALLRQRANSDTRMMCAIARATSGAGNFAEMGEESRDNSALWRLTGRARSARTARAAEHPTTPTAELQVQRSLAASANRARARNHVCRRDGCARVGEADGVRS